MDFENKAFVTWLDEQAQLAMNKVTSGKGLESQEIMILVLKAQTNHVAHMEQDLRQEMVDLREDMNRRFEQVDRHLEQVDKHLEQVDKRLDQVDKNFERVDKRFEQVDKNMNAMIGRIDNFMKWSFGTTIAVGALVVAVLQYLG